MGGAFEAVECLFVAAFVADFVTPLIAAVGGQPDFAGLKFKINGSEFKYGHFFNAVISFLIIAAVIFFFVVRPLNALAARRKKDVEPEPDAPAEDIRLLGEWRRPEHASIHNFVLRGELLYVAHYQQGVRVLDVSVPWIPMEIASFRTWREADRNRGHGVFDGAIGMRVPGDGYVYTVDTGRGLLILKHASEPAAP